MSLIETILKLAVQLAIFVMTMTIKVISSIVGALWSALVSAFQNRAPRNAYQSPLAQASRPRAKHYPRRRRKQWRRR